MASTFFNLIIVPSDLLSALKGEKTFFFKPRYCMKSPQKISLVETYNETFSRTKKEKTDYLVDDLVFDTKKD